MSLFGASEGSTDLAVDVPPMAIYVAKATANGSGQATFGDWTLESRLSCRSIFYGSSVAGASYARMEAATGQPATAQVDVEYSDMIGLGDRVCIGFDEGGSFRPLFAGYALQGQIQITDTSERIVYRVAGPEWAWGASGANAGADRVVVGQHRRTAAGDAAWNFNPATITPLSQLTNILPARCVFNPKGTKNRTLSQVYFGADETSEKGYIFEEPDRGKIASNTRTDEADYWTRKKAIHYLLWTANDPAFTGITNPAFGSVDPTVEGDVLRDVDCDGLTLSEALKKICGPGLAFSVSPIPGPGGGPYWGDFAINVFSRTGGEEADFVLSSRGTSITAATPSVVRVEAVKDITKTANNVFAYGRAVRHLTLKYKGDPATATTAEKPYLLQPGWHISEGRLDAFATDNVVDDVTIDAKGATLAQQWRDYFTTSGKNFNAAAHVFRKFVWNEAGEYTGDGVCYGPSTSPVSYILPDLTGIADAKGFVAVEDYVAGDYARRRRPFLETAYVMPAQQTRMRVKPIVYLSTKYNDEWNYHVRLPESTYQVDRNMGAIWISVGDIAKWHPFEAIFHQAADEGEGGDPSAPPSNDWMASKTFATMLLKNELRITIECSIAVDIPLLAKSLRRDGTGSPHLRNVVLHHEDSFIKSLTMDQSALGTDWGALSTLTATPIDDSDDLQTLADQSRAAGEDEQVQSSIICEGDWPIQSIGKMASSISGRSINLAAASGRGCQIVAVSLDCESMTIEHLTESAAMEVVKAEKNRIARSKVYTKGGIRT